jgi:hypothetical protein
MPYSTIVNGEVLDWHFKPLGNSCLTAFYIGDIYVGQVANMGQGGWSAATGANPHSIMPVNGFKTRTDAAIFLLKIEEYQR